MAQVWEPHHKEWLTDLATFIWKSQEEKVAACTYVKV